MHRERVLQKGNGKCAVARSYSAARSDGVVVLLSSARRRGSRRVDAGRRRRCTLRRTCESVRRRDVGKESLCIAQRFESCEPVAILIAQELLMTCESGALQRVKTACCLTATMAFSGSIIVIEALVVRCKIAMASSRLHEVAKYAT